MENIYGIEKKYDKTTYRYFASLENLNRWIQEDSLHRRKMVTPEINKINEQKRKNLFQGRMSL